MLTKLPGQMSVISKDGHEFYITPHPLAPHFAKQKEAQSYLDQLIAEIKSPNWTPSAESILLLRELALVQLWFCEKYVFGPFGPFSLLTEELHLEMCNWRQSAYCMDPGAHFIALLTRGFFKTSTLTTGADAWELIRNPNLKIGLTNAVEPLAYKMKSTIHRIFDSNDLMAILFPECIQKKGNKELIMANRTKHANEASVTVLSLGKAAESLHFDLFDIDDPIGLSDLSADRSMTVSVDRKKKWYATNHKSLLMSWGKSRIGIKATRYGRGDFFQPMCDSVKTLNGYYELDEFNVMPDIGEWNVYYRLPVEYGKPIFEEVADIKSLDDLKKKDAWSYATQACNRSLDTGLNELANFSTGRCSLISTKTGYFIKKYLSEEDALERGFKYQLVDLADCDVVMGTDLAGSEGGNSYQVCQTALTIWALDSDQDLMLIWDAYGKFPILRTFEEIVAGYQMFKYYLRSIEIETDAMQIIIEPLLEKHALYTKGIGLPLNGVKGGSNKIGRIRTGIGQPLMLGHVYLDRKLASHFEDEQSLFPLDKHRLDYLDASEKAFRSLFKAPDEIPGDLRNDSEEEEEEYRLNANPLTGY